MKIIKTGRKARSQSDLLVLHIRASNKEDAGSALERAEGDVPADLFCKGRSDDILADEALFDLGHEYAHGVVMIEVTCRHEVGLSGEY